MELNNILKLIDAVSESSLSSFSLEDGQVRLNLSNVNPNQIDNSTNNNCYNIDAVRNKTDINESETDTLSYKSITAAATEKEINTDADNVKNSINDSLDGMAKETVTHDKSELSGNEKQVVSPLVGTFYNSASPEDEPMVSVGDTVKKGQVIGIIEAMKLMNEIESDYDGVVKEILVNNEDVVEYGQPLFVIA